MSLLLVGALLVATSLAAREPGDTFEEKVREAEQLFDREDFQGAIEELYRLPGMAAVIPVLSPLKGEVLAKIYFDMANCFLAVGDSASARTVMTKAVSLLPDISEGYFERGDLTGYRKTLAALKESERLAETTRRGAFARSLLLPGWGQMHRGHKLKGAAMMAASLGAAGLWFVKYRSYQSALGDYRTTTLADVATGGFYQDAGGGGEYTEFEARYRIAQSKASAANRWLMAFAGLYLLNLTDSVVAGPGFVAVSVKLSWGTER